jgi:hypothetical protein
MVNIDLVRKICKPTANEYTKLVFPTGTHINDIPFFYKKKKKKKLPDPGVP